MFDMNMFKNKMMSTCFKTQDSLFPLERETSPSYLMMLTNEHKQFVFKKKKNIVSGFHFFFGMVAFKI